MVYADTCLNGRKDTQITEFRCGFPREQNYVSLSFKKEVFLSSFSDLRMYQYFSLVEVKNMCHSDPVYPSDIFPGLSRDWIKIRLVIKVKIKCVTVEILFSVRTLKTLLPAWRKYGNRGISLSGSGPPKSPAPLGTLYLHPSNSQSKTKSVCGTLVECLSVAQEIRVRFYCRTSDLFVFSVALRPR